ncbi:hypothetical protein [Achromobacter sp.]|uniref:hypothetical protein n=1 Tax=Achromobacter sp. TaxID=134375 RepID=UPI0028A9048E|nr:hypothetical protein [Achromobacter sp.]
MSYVNGALSSDQKKKPIGRKGFIFNIVLLAGLFGIFAHLLMSQGFLRPGSGASPASDIEIQATGDKNQFSKGTEVWLHGAFGVNDGKKIPWESGAIDSAWEKRDDFYVSYRAQPNAITLKYEKPVVLELLAHPFAGMVRLKWEGNMRDVDLHSTSTHMLRIVVDPRPTYMGTIQYLAVLAAFASIGAFFGLATSFLGRKVYRFLFLLLLLIAIYLNLAIFYPGVYSNDSADQLRQALGQNYRDWHPPLMAWFWSVLISVTGRAESMWLFHLLLLAAGAMCWAIIMERSRVGWLSFMLPLFLISPVVLNFSSVVWKDVGFAFALFLSSGIAGLCVLERRVSLLRAAVAGSLLVYAFGVRSNGIFALIPIAAILIYIILEERWPLRSALAKGARTVALCGIATVALVAGVHTFTYDYLKATKTFPIQYLEIYDIAGISTISGKDYFPKYLKDRPEHDFSRISESYIKAVGWGNANSLVFRRTDGTILIPLSRNPEFQEQLRSSWLEAIFSEPVAYMSHRLAVIQSLMSNGNYFYEMPQSEMLRHTILGADNIGNTTLGGGTYKVPGAEAATEVYTKLIDCAKGTYLYVGWLWLAVLFVPLVVGLTSARRTPFGILIVMISASGLLYVLPYLIIAPASDFRYLFWSIISGGVSAMLLAGLALISIRGVSLRRKPPNLQLPSAKF